MISYKKFENSILKKSRFYFAYFSRFIAKFRMRNLLLCPYNFTRFPENINQFVSNAPFLYPLKTSENRKGALGTNGLRLNSIHTPQRQG